MRFSLKPSFFLGSTVFALSVLLLVHGFYHNQIYFAVLSPKNEISNSSIRGKIILIDAGHGGIDGGSNVGKILEKDINLEVALKLSQLLLTKGAKPILSRSKDHDLSGVNPLAKGRHKLDLNNRVNWAQQQQGDLVISLHCDFSNDPSYRGGRIFYYAKNQPFGEQSSTLARALQEQFNFLYSKYANQRERYLHQPLEKEYYVLSNSKIPWVIVEMGFLSNPKDRQLLTQPSFQWELADVIFRGLDKYFNEAKDNQTIKR